MHRVSTPRRVPGLSLLERYRRRQGAVVHLLSFAQFEREVIGERIHDKFAASRKKGMWMGGWAPLGYRVESWDECRWRREGDSNPRYGCPYTRVPGVRLQPLGHPSRNQSGGTIAKPDGGARSCPRSGGIGCRFGAGMRGWRGAVRQERRAVSPMIVSWPASRAGSMCSTDQRERLGLGSDRGAPHAPRPRPSTPAGSACLYGRSSRPLRVMTFRYESSIMARNSGSPSACRRRMAITSPGRSGRGFA